MKYVNPFPILDYVGPEYFCNRVNETAKLSSAYKNGRNITLTSIRRLGKTGLIKHFFNTLKNEDIRILYIDILKTQNLSEFVKAFSNKILEDEKNNANWFSKLSKLISGIKARISFDEISGAPSIEFGHSSDTDTEKSLESIFNYLANQKEEYLIAFDEFQQITNYPEKNVEAVLRTAIQNQHKDRFIFSGSSKHILISMFNDYARPFYQSAEILNLERLELVEYSGFIKKLFARYNKTIDKEIIDYYVNFLDVHTFYVQYFFNKLFDKSDSVITEIDAQTIFDEILKEKEFVYLNYRNILTKLQFKLLEAIAKEDGVSKPNASYFLREYNFSQASSVNKTLEGLLNKELIYRENNQYKVYDVFFSKWLKQL